MWLDELPNEGRKGSKFLFYLSISNNCLQVPLGSTQVSFSGVYILEFAGDLADQIRFQREAAQGCLILLLVEAFFLVPPSMLLFDKMRGYTTEHSSQQLICGVALLNQSSSYMLDTALLCGCEARQSSELSDRGVELQRMQVG
jgi:hypothetical protein